MEDENETRARFQMREGRMSRIHAMLVERKGQLVLELMGDSAIRIQPRAANMVWITLEDQ